MKEKLLLVLESVSNDPSVLDNLNVEQLETIIDLLAKYGLSK